MNRQKTYEKENSKLYLVATPIGNIEDITFRAVRILKEVDIIYCEDTRTSFQLLNHYDIITKLKSVHLFNENEISEDIVDKVIKGQNIALISDAGMPIISDPGWVVVREAIKNNVDVVVVPGPSAGISALIGSGITAHPYYFAGFLNSKSGKRKQELKELYLREETIVMYESPHRIKETLEMIDELYGDRPICLARELTKKYEEYLRGTAQEILQVVDTIKGEMVLIISGNPNPKTDEQLELNDLTITEHYDYYIKHGLDSKEAISKVAHDRNVSKKDIYNVIKK